jgi:hypothetical protein
MCQVVERSLHWLFGTTLLCPYECRGYSCRLQHTQKSDGLSGAVAVLCMAVICNLARVCCCNLQRAVGAVRSHNRAQHRLQHVQNCCKGCKGCWDAAASTSLAERAECLRARTPWAGTCAPFGTTCAGHLSARSRGVVGCDVGSWHCRCSVFACCTLLRVAFVSPLATCHSGETEVHILSWVSL